MSRKTLIRLATALTAASIQLSGCGKSPASQVPPVTQAPPSATLQADQSTDELVQQHRAMMAQLNLTDAQKGQIRAIKQRSKDPAAKQAMKDKLQYLGTQISAETVDQEAIEQTMEEIHAAFRAKAPRIATMAGEIRDILTPEQRQRAITLLTENSDEIKAMMDRLRDRGFAELSANLNLTTEQSAGLQELKRLDETSDERKFDTLSAAMVTFLQNGNQESLRSSIESAISDENIDEVVDWIATLNQTQRQQLVTNLKAYMAKLKAMHRAMRADMGDTSSDDD